MMITTATLTSDEHDGDNYDDNNDDDGDDNHQTMPSDDDDDVVVVVVVACLSLFSLMMVQLALPDDLQHKLSKFDCAPDIIALVIATLCKVCTPLPLLFFEIAVYDFGNESDSDGSGIIISKLVTLEVADS